LEALPTHKYAISRDSVPGTDVFRARVSIGNEMINPWLETYQTSRDFRKRGIVELEQR
jgi:hypothetical protein